MKEGNLVVNPKYRSRQVLCRILDAASEILLLLAIAFAGQAALLAERSLSRPAGQVLLLGLAGVVFSVILGRAAETVGTGLCAQVEEELQNTAYRQILEGDWQLVSRMHQGEAEQRIQRDSGITARAVTKMRRRLGKSLVGLVAMPVFLLFYDRAGAAALAVAMVSASCLAETLELPEEERLDEPTAAMDGNYWIAGREIRPVQQVVEETAAARACEDVEEPHLPEAFRCGRQ